MQLQLLFRQIRNQTIGLNILNNKFTLLLWILLLFLLKFNSGTAERSCHHCSGINCVRPNYEAKQQCVNDFDICVSVFEGSTVLAQGCFEQLSQELRNKCSYGTQTSGSSELGDCIKCNVDLCNNLASSSFQCIQCDSNSDENCRSNPLDLPPSRCNISRTPNEYCFAKQEGNRVVRGCSKTLDEQMSCLSSTDCMICQPNELRGCNNLVIVDNASDNSSGGSEVGGSSGGDSGNNGLVNGSDSAIKRKCHQCSGINCLRTTYESSQNCFNDLDICVTVFDGQTILAQGCLEQLSEELRDKCNTNIQDPRLTKNECFKCNENLCNNLASSAFECIQCDSDNDEYCARNTSNLSSSRCGISRTLNEYCFVRYEENRVIRGCSNTLEHQISCLSNAGCTICQPSEMRRCNDIEVAVDDGGSGSGSDSSSGDGGSDSSGSGSDSESGSGSGSGSDSGSASGNGSADGSESQESGNDADGSESGNGGSQSDGSENGNNGTESGGSDNGFDNSASYINYSLLTFNLYVIMVLLLVV